MMRLKNLLKNMMSFACRLCVVFVVALLLCVKVMAEELHFDLPKKDPKEQCKEVERAVRECEKSIITDGKIHKCGNVYISEFYFIPLIDMSYDGLVPYLIMDEYGVFIASNISNNMFFVLQYGDKTLFETSSNSITKSFDIKNIIYFKNSNCNISKVWLAR